VLVGHCSDAEGTPPYLPFVESIEAVLAGESTDALRARLGNEAVTLRELLPRTVARLPEVPRDPARIDRHALFQAVTAVLSSIAAGHGALIILEDLHWADKPSLLLLKHVVEHAGSAPIAIVATYRDVEVNRSHPLAALLTELRRNPAVERVALAGLGVDNVRALVDAVTSAPPELAAALCERTNGNPLFVHEVLRQRLEANTGDEPAIPEGIRDVIGQRLSRLGEATNRMLRCAAVIGATFHWDVLAAVADQGGDALLDALDEALASQVIRERKQGAQTRYEFGHALVRETLYDELSAPRRARLHRKVGEAIESVHHAAIDAHVVDLAHHYFQSATADRAIDYCTRAGDRAIAQAGYEEATAQFTRALDMVGQLDASDDERGARRCELYERRARALTYGGGYDAARADIDRALDSVASPERRAELLVERAATSHMLLDIPAQRAAAHEILGIAKTLNRDDTEAAGLAWQAVSLVADGDFAGAIALFERSVELAGIRESYVVALAYMPLALYWVARYREAAVAAARVLDVSRQANDVMSTTLTLPHRALSLASLGEYAEALATFDEARAYGARHGNHGLAARVLSMRGGTYLALLDYEAAEALAHEATALAGRGAFIPPVIASALDLVLIAIRRGDHARAEAQLAEVAPKAEAAGAWHRWVWRLRLDEIRAELALRKGEHAAAIELATRADDQAVKCGRLRYRVWSRCLRGHALAASDRHGDAHADLDAALAGARELHEPALLLHALCASLAVRPDLVLAAEARTLVRTLAAAHPEETTRARLLARVTIPG
jgi:tetratricopeptide (TPR) repeat protein